MRPQFKRALFGLIPVVFLAACASEPPNLTQMDEADLRPVELIAVGGEPAMILMPSANERARGATGWEVRVLGQTNACAAPTEQSCRDAAMQVIPGT